MRALTKPFKMRVRVPGLNYLIGDKSSLQLHPCCRSAQLNEQEWTPSKASWSQLESVNNNRHLKQKPSPIPSIFTYKLQPLNEQVIAQQGSEGQNRCPKLYMLESHWCRARQPSDGKLTWLRIWAHQTIALLIFITIRSYMCDSLDNIVENIGPPVRNWNCRPLRQIKKYLQDILWEPSDPN